MENKKIYQNTLNLPQTDFSMKANLAQREPQFLEKWEKDGLYPKIKAKQLSSKKRFILHDGPPYANGHIHIGHALNKTLKDFIIKSKTMQGNNSYYVPGWDCHGLPIEHQLLKDLKKKKSEVDCLEIRKKAHEYALKFVDIQREEFKRLGVFGDWQNPYLTLNHEYEYWILKSLADLQRKGYVYRGLKPVNWCFSCETALAEAEVEYEDHKSASVYVKFKVTNPDVISELPKKDLNLLIWTTTPWTLLANVAVAVHPEFEYLVLEANGDLLIIESSLAPRVLGKINIQDFKTIKKIKGKELTKLTYSHPFQLRNHCPVVAVDYVTKEDGTGLVHTAPGHGQEDYETGVKYKLDVIMPVDDKGVYTKEAGSYEGQHVFKANPVIVEDLKNLGLLFNQEEIQHTYPHCWRCKNPIIFRATKQWFLKIDHNNLRQKLKDSIHNEVKWVPPGGEERILSMVSTRPDWCLSRQRYWGVPIPAIINKEGEHELHPEVIDQFADVVKREGTDAWFEKDIQEFIPKNLKLKFAPSEYKKGIDILDVWFDSGVSHQGAVKAMMHYELPIEMYLEGSDQHRGWFQSSLIPAVAMEGKPPFREVLTHGFVVDGQGRKMSKSLGNVVSPQEIIKLNGSDILRLWVASSSYNDDIRISKEILERLIDAYRKIRNTFRYLLGNIYDFDPNKDIVEYKQLLALDRWALYKLASTTEAVEKSYNQYEFAKVYKTIFSFCNEDLSSFYLDILKDRLYTSQPKSLERRSAQTVLYQILNYLVRLSAPIFTFTSQEIFESMPKTKELASVSSVHLLDWLSIPDQWKDDKIDEEYRLIVSLRPHVLKALEEKRKTGAIGSSLEAKVIFETASDRDHQYLEFRRAELPSIFIVSQVELKKVAGVTNGLSEEFNKTRVQIENASGSKCERCWNYKLDVGTNVEHPTLCARCTGIVKESR